MLGHERCGIVEVGKMALLAGVGPMGLGTIGYVVQRDRKPSHLVVTDNDDAKTQRAASIYIVKCAKACGVELDDVRRKTHTALESF